MKVLEDLLSAVTCTNGTNKVGFLQKFTPVFSGLEHEPESPWGRAWIVWGMTQCQVSMEGERVLNMHVFGLKALC